MKNSSTNSEQATAQVFAKAIGRNALSGNATGLRHAISRRVHLIPTASLQPIQHLPTNTKASTFDD
jgi:hypothetical protein